MIMIIVLHCVPEEQVGLGFAERRLSCDSDVEICKPERRHNPESLNLLQAKLEIPIFHLLGKTPLGLSNNPPLGCDIDTGQLCTHRIREKSGAAVVVTFSSRRGWDQNEGKF